MKFVKVSKEIENPLFARREVEVLVTSEVNPKKSEALNILGEKFNADSDGIRIKKISGKFGTNDFVITANVYKNKETMLKNEHFSKKEKEKMKKELEEKSKPVEENKEATE